MFPSKQSPPQRDSNPGSPEDQHHRLRRRSNVDPAKAQLPHRAAHNLYFPKVYTYKCYGKFTTSSIDTVNHGQCHGIPTKLETLYNEQIRVSRVEALKRFTTMTADGDLDDYQNQVTSTSEMDNDNSELNQQSVFLSPALIYKYDNRTGLVNNPDAIVKKTDSSNETTNTSNDTPTVPRTPAEKVRSDDILPEEELIVEQSWTCYGVTEIEYLSLENVYTGESKLVAVAPLNTGVSVREIETDDSVRTLTRCSLGWIDILHDSNTILVDDDDDEIENSATAGPQATVPSAAIRNEDDTGKILEGRSMLPQLSLSKDVQETINSMESIGRKSLDRTAEFSKLVLEHMKLNSMWFIRNVQDDFPSRTYTAGKAIVTQVPKSLESISNEMNKLLQRIFRGRDDGDDSGNDDHFPPPGGRRF
jgi:hypothetical protein